MLRTAKFEVEVAYDDAITDPEALASALDRLMETALSTPCILDEYGNPVVGEFFPQPVPGSDPDENWANDAIQFPRLIEEAQGAGIFHKTGIARVAKSMDLSVNQVRELLDRAARVWEAIKEKT